MTVRRGVVMGVVAVGVWLWAVPAALADDSVTPVCNGQPCATTAGFWYASPVTLVWQVSQNPMPTGLQGCGTQSYLTDTAAATTSCEAMWANVDDIKRYTIHVEVSNPTASAAPARPPDVNGWYNHPVVVVFTGSAFSAIASCTPPTAYAGPATPTATVSGSCTDNAGKSAATSVMFRYDATPPSLTIAADSGDRTVDLHWSAIEDAAPLDSVSVTRTPGLHGSAPSVLYHGQAGGYADSRVRNGLRYRYEFHARDQAGNVTVSSMVVTPGPRLLTPAPRARLNTPPLLQWTPVRGASYYNVQLYRAGIKVLSAWPARARLQLRLAWRLDGRRYRLASGSYRWYVWPGFGRPAAARYGRPIGTRTFVVERHA